MPVLYALCSLLSALCSLLSALSVRQLQRSNQDPMPVKTITVKLKVWRQAAQNQPGRLVDYVANNVSTDMSFLEMLDVVNEDLIPRGEDPIAFDSDCREGICGSCGLTINGVAHGPDLGATTCQLHMRRYRDGETIT